MNKIKMTLVVLLFCQAAAAQTMSTSERVEKKVARIEEKVALTPEQKVSITAVVSEHITKLQALKESGELDETARKAIAQSQRDAIAEVLTEEQKTILKREMARTRGTKEVKKAIKAERQAQKIALKQKRAEFEHALSDEDKKIIAAARALLPTKLSKEQKDQLTAEEKEARKATKKEVRKMLNPIVQKHQSDIDQIYDTVFQRDVDKKKRKAFAVKFLLMNPS